MTVDYIRDSGGRDAPGLEDLLPMGTGRISSALRRLLSQGEAQVVSTGSQHAHVVRLKTFRSVSRNRMRSAEGNLHE